MSHRSVGGALVQNSDLLPDEVTGHWSVGRVINDEGDGVTVRFADRNDVSCDYSEVFVRCKRPIEDPVEYLAQQDHRNAPIRGSTQSLFGVLYPATRFGLGNFGTPLIRHRTRTAPNNSLFAEF